MAKKFVRVLEDIEEALSREVRKITFFEQRTRGAESGYILKEMFDVFTGEYVKKSIEPQFYADTADALISTSPRFTLRLLSLAEDKASGRGTPPYGHEELELLPSAPVYSVRFGGEELQTTNLTGTSTVTINNRKIREVIPGDLLEIITGNNIGVYKIASINLLGNGPHELVLDDDIVSGLPTFDYSRINGLITFSESVDISAVKIGDTFVDASSNSATITAVDQTRFSISITPNSIIATASGSKVNRTGNILTGLDSNVAQCYRVLNSGSIRTGVSHNYRRRNALIPYNFVYYIKITSLERDDHIAIANRMMQVFNPPRGALCTIVRSQISSQEESINNIDAGSKIIYLNNVSDFSVGEEVQVFDNLSYGECAKIESINIGSNAITLKTALTKSYKVDQCASVVSNSELCTFERDFINHATEDRESEQLWIHRFTYRVEAWVEAKLDPCSDNLDEATYEDIQDVKFIKVCLENMEGTIKDINLIS